MNLATNGQIYAQGFPGLWVRGLFLGFSGSGPQAFRLEGSGGNLRGSFVPKSLEASQPAEKPSSPPGL